MDGSIKIYDIQNNNSELQADLIVDSNAMAPAEGESAEPDPWKFCFNPRNNS